MGVLDSAMPDAKIVHARGPCLQLSAVAAGEGDMIQASAVLVEFVACALSLSFNLRVRAVP